MIDKFIYLILLWSWIFGSIVITSLHSSVNHVCNTAWNILPEWNSTPHVHWDKNRHKTSHGTVRFSRNLWVSKELCYNERNCKSGRHNYRHTFIRHKPWKIRKDTNTTSLPNIILKVKTRNDRETKLPPPRRQDQMICAIHHHQVAEHLDSIEVSQHICLTMSWTYTIILYPRNLPTLIALVSTFLATVFLDTFFRILIRSTNRVHGQKLYYQPRNQGV